MEYAVWSDETGYWCYDVTDDEGDILDMCGGFSSRAEAVHKAELALRALKRKEKKVQNDHH